MAINNDISDDEIARIICTLDNTATAIVMLTPELEITYINNASANFLRQYVEDFSSVYSGFDPDHVVGLNLETIDIIPGDKLERLKDPKKLPYAKFIDVGKEKFHITINPLYTDDGKFIGSVGEWWWATEYLNSQEDSQKVAEIHAVMDIIDNITFQSDILSMNAAVEAASAGEQGRAFGVIAKEMRELAKSTRSAMRDIKKNIAG